MSIFLNRLPAYFLGIAIGFSSTNTYYKYYADLVPKEKMIKNMDEVALYACVQGVIDTVSLFTKHTDQAADCRKIRDSWVGIYK